jgi:hypothetical protein
MTLRPDHTATGHINIIAKGKCVDGRYYLKLRIRSEGKYRTEILSLDALDSDPVKTPSTLRANLFTSQARREFLQRVQGSIDLPVTFRVTTRPGWCGGAFVLPSGRVVGSSCIAVCLAADKSNVGAKFRRRGDFEAWRRIPELARGNSRLMLALALSFVGPLGDLLRVEQVMIQLVGEPESGKSGIAVAAGSVWGGRKKAGRVDFSESWNCTDNELETLAAAHSGAFVVFDETRAADRKRGKLFDVFDGVVMRLAEGAMKGRMTDQSAPLTWWEAVLSTSNRSLDQMAAEAGAEIDDAHRGRLIDVPSPVGPSGIFAHLHGFLNHAALTTELKRVAGENYGWASDEYLRRLVREHARDKPRLLRWLVARREDYKKVARRRIVHGQRKAARIHEKFATIYAAGALAIAFGILPWDRRAMGHALLSCEQAHFDLVAGAEPSRQLQPESKSKSDPWVLLKSHVRAHRREFVDLRKGLVGRPASHKHSTCVGYVNNAPDGSIEFLFSNGKLREICGSRAALLQLKQKLSSDGMLLEDERRRSTRRTIWENGEREQVIAIRARAFSKQSASAGRAGA